MEAYPTNMSTVQIKGSTTQGLRNTRSASVLRRPCSAGECGASGTRTTSAMTANAMHAATTSTQYACCQVMTLRSMRAAGSANTKDALKPSAHSTWPRRRAKDPRSRLAAM